MLSIITSGLNAAQKDLSVTANNLANAGTTGFKRSEASFLDLYSNDPSSNPRTQIGSGTTLGDISRSTSQGPLKTTGNVTDLAITGRGFFTLARDDGSLMYTRAGNFTADVNGVIVDSQSNPLQCFALDASGNPAIDQALSSVTIPTEKSPGQAKINLPDTAPVGAAVTLKIAGALVGAAYKVTSADRIAGFVTFTSAEISSAVKNQIGASIDDDPNLPDTVGPYDVSGEYQPFFTQGLSIDTKGTISANFSDGTSSPIGAIAIANFAYEPGLRAIGDTNFVQSVDSGQPTMTGAGAPAAGEIRSGMLEESNVDMTAELMQMLKAQQVYNGNARMMQTSVDLVSRITDKI